MGKLSNFVQSIMLSKEPPPNHLDRTHLMHLGDASFQASAVPERHANTSRRSAHYLFHRHPLEDVDTLVPIVAWHPTIHEGPLRIPVDIASANLGVAVLHVVVHTSNMRSNQRVFVDQAFESNSSEN